MKEFLKSKNFLDLLQSGFRKQHSTTTAVVFTACFRQWTEKSFVLLCLSNCPKQLTLLITEYSVKISSQDWHRQTSSHLCLYCRVQFMRCQKVYVKAQSCNPFCLICANDLSANLSDTSYLFYADDTVIYSIAVHTQLHSPLNSCSLLHVVYICLLTSCI